MVALERVDALELARTGVCCGRGRWWISYAWETIGEFVTRETNWTGTDPTLHGVVEDFERFLDLDGEQVREQL